MKIQTLPTAGTKPSSCLVLMLVQQDNKSKNSPAMQLPKPLGSIVQKAITSKLFKGKVREALFMPYISTNTAQHVLLVGLGPADKVDHEAIRQACSTACRTLETHSQRTACLDFSTLLLLERDVYALARAISEGFILAGYQFKDCQKKDKNSQSMEELTLIKAQNMDSVKKGLLEGQSLAESMNFARWLADHPSNLMTPTILAKEVQKKFKGMRGLQVTVWDKSRIIKEKMGGVLGVSAGSQQEPRVIIMEYKGGGSKTTSKGPLCFVGKGLTFDSGGISLKPAKDMDEMKFDMCGSVAVIGTLLAIARLKLPVHALGLVGSCENMPGGGATKPGDILKARNGKTMEVLNTDAEGRLVLADILSYACEKKPQFIVDAATLTGAVVGALGNIYSGLFTRHKNLETQIIKASQKSGEKIWPLPLHDFHTKDITSRIGDVANIGATWEAGSSTAAAFLEHFVDKKIPWAHMDIAGTAYNVANRLPYCRPKSASGVMIRTFVELSRQYIR